MATSIPPRTNIGSYGITVISEKVSGCKPNCDRAKRWQVLLEMNGKTVGHYRKVLKERGLGQAGVNNLKDAVKHKLIELVIPKSETPAKTNVVSMGNS